MLVSMVLLPILLVGYRSLIFTLSCELENGYKSTVSSIDVINIPPQAGYYSVTPIGGTSLVTTFDFIASQWSDMDVPLSYEFGYITNNNLFLVLRLRITVAYDPSLLTSGIIDRNFTLNSRVQVYDSMGASSYLDFEVRVK